MEELQEQTVTIQAISSPTIGALAKALCKAQGEIVNPKKVSDNRFFKSKYADLAECLDSGLPAITNNGLAITQLMQGSDLHTVLMHESGEWIKSVYPVITSKKDAQGWGAGITYARRYMLCAIIGIAQEDDDGNQASGKKLTKKEVMQEAAENSTGAPDYYDIAAEIESDMHNCATLRELSDIWSSNSNNLRWIEEYDAGLRENLDKCKDKRKAELGA